jgi:hypothetical protein
MKKITLLLICFIAIQTKAQVNIGANTAPNTDAMVEISGSSKGLLLPRIALTSTSSFAPLSAHVAGMAIYNTATAGVSPNNVVPGYYYNDGAKWIRLLNQSSDGTEWYLTGTAIDAAGDKTSDIFRNGSVGIGTSPASKLDVAAGSTTVNTIVNGTGAINDYLQFNVQNTSNGAHAQSGYAATADNGSATTGFAWIGINNSTFNFPTAYNIGGSNDVSYVGSGNDMYIANANNTKSIIFSTGKSTTPYFNERMRLTNAGNFGIGTSTPASKLDVAAGTTTVNTVINAVGSINDYLQFNIQNTSTGTQAQSGYAATADNGTATTGFAWIGINNSTFNFPTAYNIGGANDVSYVGSGQDMYIANANNTKSIIFSTGKSTTPYFNERMRMTNSGFLGIGTTSPSAKLDLTGIKSTGAGIGTGASNDGPSQAIITSGQTGTSRFNDWPSGWGGGLSVYDVCGAGTFFNTYVTRSDIRLKKDINSMSDQITANLLKLRPVTYLMKEQIKESEGLQYGFIAQEVKVLFPSIVTESSDPNGIIGMNYQALIAPAIYVIQQQQVKIEKLQSEIELVKTQNDNLQKVMIEIEKLKTQLKSLQSNSK